MDLAKTPREQNMEANSWSNMVCVGFDLKHRVHIDMATFSGRCCLACWSTGRTFHEERLRHKACWTWLIWTALWPGGLDSCGVVLGSVRSVSFGVVVVVSCHLGDSASRVECGAIGALQFQSVTMLTHTRGVESGSPLFSSSLVVVVQRAA